jgi:hypothetical protein
MPRFWLMVRGGDGSGCDISFFSCATAISVHSKMYPPLPLTRQAAV